MKWQPFAGNYILDAERRPVHEPDLMVWAEWMSDISHRIVRQETTKLYWVSTVFLGLDCGYADGPPILFETMVFTRAKVVSEMFGRLARARQPIDEDGMQLRYVSWDDAETGHRTMVRRLRKQEADAKTMSRTKGS